MGWKLSALIIDKLYEGPIEEFTIPLGFGKSILDGKLPLKEALYPDQFCIGFYKTCTVVTHQKIIFDFFNSKSSSFENSMVSIFGGATIMAVGQIENAGINGFSLIKNGKRIRTRLQGEEEGVIIDLGERLKQEDGLDMTELPFTLPTILLGDSLDSDLVLRTPMDKLQPVSKNFE